MKSLAQPRLTQYAFALLLLVAFSRIAIFAYRYIQESLQMDFSAFYTAGEALNHGFSPYKNNILEAPNIWDGINLYEHSRFHYPPLAANLFQFIAILPYATAKWVWTIFIFACLGFSLGIVLRVLKPPLPKVGLWILGTLVCMYYPLLLLLERGQVDTITLLLLTTGLFWLATDRRHAGAGGLFALATLLKIHCIYILPFLLLRRQWKAALGMLAGGAVLVGLSTLVNGPTSILDYIRVEIPAISNSGLNLPEANDPIRGAVKDALMALPEGYTLKDGSVYRLSSLAFDDNATLVRTRFSNILKSITQRLLNWEPNLMAGSLFYFGFFFILFAASEGACPEQSEGACPEQSEGACPEQSEGVRRFRTRESAPGTEFLYWQIPLGIILLCAPLTWPMNCVWLLPAGILFIHESSNRGKINAPALARARGAILGIGLLGFVLVGMPDSFAFQELPEVARLMRHKLVLGEFLMLAGMWGILQVHRKIGH